MECWCGSCHHAVESKAQPAVRASWKHSNSSTALGIIVSKCRMASLLSSWIKGSWFHDLSQRSDETDGRLSAGQWYCKNSPTPDSRRDLRLGLRLEDYIVRLAKRQGNCFHSRKMTLATQIGRITIIRCSTICKRLSRKIDTFRCILRRFDAAADSTPENALESMLFDKWRYSHSEAVVSLHLRVIS